MECVEEVALFKHAGHVSPPCDHRILETIDTAEHNRRSVENVMLVIKGIAKSRVVGSNHNFKTRLFIFFFVHGCEEIKIVFG